MPLSSKLDRKLRAVEESSDEDEYYEVTDRSSSASVIEYGDAEEIPSSDEEGDNAEDDEMVSPHALGTFTN
jgi:ribosomal RNA-processing protein 36